MRRRRRRQSPMRHRARSAILALTFAGTLLLPSSSSAVIIVGSDLTPPATATTENCVLTLPPCTRLPFQFHAGNAFLPKSPTNGVITSFGIKTGGAESVTFRLGQFQPKGGTKGTGTGPTVALPGPGTYSIPASLPVQANDSIGMDGSSTRAVSAPPMCGSNGNPAVGYILLHPPLVNGVTQQGGSSSSCDLLVNAVIVPSSKLKFGGVEVTAGVGILTVITPGPGKLSVSGGAHGGAKAKQAGAVKLKVKPTGDAKARLASSGHVTITPRIRFAPRGGTPRSVRHRVRLHL